MKLTEFRKLIREEIQKAIKEYGSSTMYFTPGGFEQMSQNKETQLQRFDNLEKWKIRAMQLGAVIKDRGDDVIAVMPNQDKIGSFDKMIQSGQLYL
jgi:TRAP-type C4-dicarboxylate transport system substrate-binding protein